jgi:hypothetical protein
MRIERKWAMPNKWTFTIKPIAELLKEEMTPGLWIDGMAGLHSPAQVKNDLNPEHPADYHIDAMEFYKHFEPYSVDGVLFDPPYSITQASQCYKEYGKEKLEINVANMGYWSGIKNQIALILKPGGKVICCGWSSMGLGLKRGFEMTRVLLVPHGGSKNDTIVTVELKRSHTPQVETQAKRGVA